MDTNRVTVLFADNGTWTELPDQWDQVTVLDLGDPPPGLVAPVRGFGWLWGTHREVAQRLGWAREEEKGFCANVQSFERGYVAHSSPVPSCTVDGLYNQATDPAFGVVFFSAYSNGTWRPH